MSAYAWVVEDLSRLAGVRGVVLASPEDGIPILSTAHEGVRAEVLAAFGVALLGRASALTVAAGGGDATVLVCEASGGRLTAAGNAECVLVVLSERSVAAGLVRVAMMRALGRVT